MADLLLRSWPMFLAPAPMDRCRRSQVALRRRGGGGSGVWGLCRRSRVGASDLELVYSTESSDGSVVFRFGTASEVAEYMALKEAEREQGAAQVEDGTLQENGMSGYEEEAVEGFADEILDTKLPVEDPEKFVLKQDEVDRKSGSSEILRGAPISSNYVGVSDSHGIVSNVPVEKPSVREDIDESLRMGKVGIVENSISYKVAVESGFVNRSGTFEKSGDSDGDVELTLGKEKLSLEISSVLDVNSECNLEKDNVEVEIADDFGGNVGKDNRYLENSCASDENADGNAFKELVAAESVISDEDSEPYAGDDSKIAVDDDPDPMALELDATVSLSLDEASSYVDTENVLRHSIDDSVSSSEENSIPIRETIDEPGYGSNPNGNFELLASETKISAEDFESDDKEIPVVDNALTADDETGCDSEKGHPASQKTSLSEVIYNEEMLGFSSLLGKVLDADSVVEQPSADSIVPLPAILSTSEGGLSDECSNETNVIQDTLAIAVSSTSQEDTDDSKSVTVPESLQPENEIILDEGIEFDSMEGFLCSTSIDSLNQTAGKDNPTSEVINVSEADKLGISVTTTISVSKATEQIPVQVTDREEASPVRLCLSIGAALLPKTLEALSGGEDAYFIAGETWFGVADGIGQWSLEGIDAGLYGHELMECCRRIVSDGGCSPTNTKEVLSRGAAEATLPGSATVLVAYFDGQVLQASNIGDTGFVIVRNGVGLSRSSSTVHDFHFPHRIQKGNNPLEFVELYEIELNEGDIIVAATDGLFDNMYDKEIASIVTKSLQADMSPEEVAAVLAVKAQEIGRSTSTRSPFADAAQAAGYAACTGGKLDDVAVIVSVVQKKS